MSRNDTVLLWGMVAMAIFVIGTIPGIIIGLVAGFENTGVYFVGLTIISTLGSVYSVHFGSTD